MALSTRFNSSCRNCSGVGRQARVANPADIRSAGRPCDAAGRRDQLHELVDDRPQVAIGAAGRLRTAGREKALQMFFGQRELPQRDGQAFLVDVATVALVKLHGDPRAGDVVAQVMGQPAAQLTQQRQPFGAFDHALHFVELAGQRIDRADQVAQLVVARRQRQGARNRRGRSARPAGATRRLAGSGRAAMARANSGHQRQRTGADHQRRIGGLPAGLAPGPFGIQNVQHGRGRRRAARWSKQRRMEIALRRLPRSAGPDSSCPNWWHCVPCRPERSHRSASWRRSPRRRGWLSTKCAPTARASAAARCRSVESWHRPACGATSRNWPTVCCAERRAARYAFSTLTPTSTASMTPAKGTQNLVPQGPTHRTARRWRKNHRCRPSYVRGARLQSGVDVLNAPLNSPARQSTCWVDSRRTVWQVLCAAHSRAPTSGRLCAREPEPSRSCSAGRDKAQRAARDGRPLGGTWHCRVWYNARVSSRPAFRSFRGRNRMSRRSGFSCNVAAVAGFDLLAAGPLASMATAKDQVDCLRKKQYDQTVLKAIEIPAHQGPVGRRLVHSQAGPARHGDRCHRSVAKWPCGQTIRWSPRRSSIWKASCARRRHLCRRLADQELRNVRGAIVPSMPPTASTSMTSSSRMPTRSSAGLQVDGAQRARQIEHRIRRRGLRQRHAARPVEHRVLGRRAQGLWQ